MEEVVDGVLVSIGNSRTCKRQASGGKRKETKRKRYSAPSGSNVYIPCKHSTKTLSCSDIRSNDVKKLRDKLYKVPEKLRQDSILSSLVVTKNVKRRRPNMPNQNKSLSAGSQHAFSANYYIQSNEKRIPVCKKNFLAITKVGRKRLANLVAKVYSGEPIEDKRGGDRKSNRSIEKKNKVRDFISNLRACESHYGRKKSKQLKRIAFEKSQGSVKGNGFKNYRFEDESEQLGVKLLKKGVKLSNIKKTVLEPLPLVIIFQLKRKKDVEKLLKLLYGEDWQNESENAFKWYKTILYDLPDGNDEEEEVCDCLDNDIGLRI
ncbi:hypothetical protein J6590_004694 [Homalodisca vitripennis]|nr:hypothetical protein J6590_004694 [Homalodisca vitripennis]